MRQGLRLASVTVNTRAKAERIVNELRRKHRGGHYDHFIDENLKSTYIVHYGLISGMRR